LDAKLLWGNFADGSIPVGKAAVSVVELAIDTVEPDLIYTHAALDTHQDHRNTAAAVLSAARRRSRVLQYEAPTSVGFTPSIFVDVADFIEGKLDVLRAHTSQVLKNGLVDLEAVRAQARFYGFRARVDLAEGFVSERFMWDLNACEHLQHRLAGEATVRVNAS
jgi:LmbE family N-acetylglucosaminyl deacetylase